MCPIHIPAGGDGGVFCAHGGGGTVGGGCDSSFCHGSRRPTLVFTQDCLSLFFIPIQAVAAMHTPHPRLFP